MNVCLRTQQRTAFPGNEDVNYTLNPGEAFAETYRVVNELRAGATSFSWSLVDNSFYPSEAALDAAERDVATPWTVPVTQQVRARFTGRRKSWKMKVSTPLDGNLTVSLKFARGGLHDLEVLSADGKTRSLDGPLGGTRGKACVHHGVRRALARPPGHTTRHRRPVHGTAHARLSPGAR